MRGFFLMTVLLGVGCGAKPNLAGDGDPSDAPSRATLTITPDSADFTSMPRVTFTIKNTGLDATGTIGLEVIDAGAASFAIAQPSCTMLAPDGECTVDIVFSATRTNGLAMATLQVSDRDVVGTTAKLQGTGMIVTGTGLTITQGASFENTAINNSSPVVMFMVTNQSSMASGLLTLATDSSGQFKVKHPDTTDPDSCTGKPVAANGGTCVFPMQFVPMSSGTGQARAGSVTAADNTGLTVTQPLAATVGRLAFPNMSNLPFSGSACAVPAANGTITFTNETWAPLDSFSAVLSDSTELFIKTTTCSSSIPAHGTCSVTVAYRNTDITTSTTKQTNLMIGAIQMAASSPNQFQVTAQLGKCDLTVAPATVGFGTSPTGTATLPQIVTVTNIGTSPRVLAMAIGGTNSADFAISSTTCPTSPSALQPAMSCTITLTAKPTTIGPGTGTLAITSGLIAPPPVTLTETGSTGFAITPPNATLTSKSGVASTAQMFMLTNQSQTTTSSHIDIGFTSADVQAYQAGPGCDFLLAGQSCVFGVTFTSSGANGSTATMNVSATIGGSAPPVSLTGVLSP